MKSDINNKLRESFLREFNNTVKQINAESKQNPIIILKSKLLFEINVCLS